MARAHRGYSLLELLLALSILAMATTIIVPSLLATNKIKETQKRLYQDEIGIYQLQMQIALNKVLEINPDSIVYETYKNECEISLVNNNIISQPGWLCYICDVDDVSFYVSLGIIYMEYEREDKVYTYPIGYLE